MTGGLWVNSANNNKVHLPDGKRRRGIELERLSSLRDEGKGQASAETQPASWRHLDSIRVLKICEGYIKGGEGYCVVGKRWMMEIFLKPGSSSSNNDRDYALAPRPFTESSPFSS